VDVQATEHASMSVDFGKWTNPINFVITSIYTLYVDEKAILHQYQLYYCNTNGKVKQASQTTNPPPIGDQTASTGQVAPPQPPATTPSTTPTVTVPEDLVLTLMCLLPLPENQFATLKYNAMCSYCV